MTTLSIKGEPTAVSVQRRHKVRLSQFTPYARRPSREVITAIFRTTCALLIESLWFFATTLGSTAEYNCMILIPIHLS